MKFIIIPLLAMFIASIMNLADLTKSSVTVGAAQTSTFAGFTDSLTFSVITIIAVGVLIAIIGGINAVGTGLTAGSARNLIILIVLGGLWVILSNTGASLIFGIPSLGGLLYLMFTLMYAIGVIQLISGGSAGGGT